jgi:hypothetical protein
MDPLITNGIDPALLRVLEKRGEAREPLPRRKRVVAPERPPEAESDEGEIQAASGSDAPRHALDDLA